MYGLYDIDGILRYVGRDLEDCLEYAKLFDLKSVEYCLIALAETKSRDLDLKSRRKVHRAMNSN